MGVYPDGSSKRLEKHTVQTRTGGSVLVAGFAVNKAKTKILIEGARANVRFDNARPIALVVRVKDNAADPMSIVRIFRMKPAKKRRTAVIAAAGTFHVTSNDMDYLSFSARKYGESSYYLTLDESPVGEYGITVSNPNNIDEKMVICLDIRYRRRHDREITAALIPTRRTNCRNGTRNGRRAEFSSNSARRPL